MITEKYKGVEITYHEKLNHWEFTYDGEERTAPSLALAKKRIDKKPKFKRIPVWTFGRWGSDQEILEGEATCITDGGNAAFVCYDKNTREKVYLHSVFPKTPENDELIARLKELYQQRRELDGLIETNRHELITMKHFLPMSGEES
jgi:hypothetical protein